MTHNLTFFKNQFSAASRDGSWKKGYCSSFSWKMTNLTIFFPYTMVTRVNAFSRWQIWLLTLPSTTTSLPHTERNNIFFLFQIEKVIEYFKSTICVKSQTTSYNLKITTSFAGQLSSKELVFGNGSLCRWLVDAGPCRSWSWPSWSTPSWSVPRSEV